MTDGPRAIEFDPIEEPVRSHAPAGVVSQIVEAVLPALCLGLAYAQAPLFCGKQNTYFVRGLADAGVGKLSSDWLAGTGDPFPLFSGMITFVSENASLHVFHLVYIAFAVAYVLALVKTMSVTTGLSRRAVAVQAALLGLIVVHSRAFSDLSMFLLGKDARALLLDGVASQSVLGPGLQPSLFGVLLILAIPLHLRGRTVTAGVAAGFAAAMHFSYVPIAAFLCAGFTIEAIWRTRSPFEALKPILGALPFVLASGFYVFMTMSPEGDATPARAVGILYEYGVPHQADPREWFGEKAVLKLALVAGALWALRMNVSAFIVLGAPVALSAVLTVAQLITGSALLGLLFPWRVSVVVVPIATAIVFAALADRLLRTDERRESVLRGLIAVTIPAGFVLAAFGIYATWSLYEERSDDTLTGVTWHVRTEGEPGMLVAVPPELDEFRLRSRTPILADRGAHPYRAHEVIEWYQRVRAAEAFTAAEAGERCQALADLRGRYGITHFVVATGERLECAGTSKVYGDATWSLYGFVEVEPAPGDTAIAAQR